jgi:hypothetical protein
MTHLRPLRDLPILQWFRTSLTQRTGVIVGWEGSCEEEKHAVIVLFEDGLPRELHPDVKVERACAPGFRSSQVALPRRWSGPAGFCTSVEAKSVF